MEDIKERTKGHRKCKGPGAEACTWKQENEKRSEKEWWARSPQRACRPF